MRICPPLKSGHPCIGEPCHICQKPFQTDERIVLIPVREPLVGPETVQALAAHARCALKGAKTLVGMIENVKDGDGSPYPIVTDKGQFKVTEAGYEE